MRNLFAALFLLIWEPGAAQHLPQALVNDALQAASANSLQSGESEVHQTNSKETAGVTQLLRVMDQAHHTASALVSRGLSNAAIDTLIVGDIPGDTLIVTGTFFNNGPVIVMNDGVLIFQNASATILGDLFVIQDGQMWASGSTLSFPQVYFYQRTWLLVNNGYVNITDCTLDFSGLSHSLAVVDNGEIEMQDVQNIGFTTAGAYGNARISIDTTNQAGEFIMKDNASLSFSNAQTVLLWHHIPAGAVADHSFPAGAAVSSYTFDNTTPGITGIGYNVTVTNSTDVMWALMPENGSDVTISGSAIRAIGAWFIAGDTVSVSGLVNNSTYTSFTAPLSDRNLELSNCTVQTWSLYVFDSSDIDVTGCIIGELGTLGQSRAVTSNVFCDGSGGYFWASENSFCVALNSSVSTYVRSEKSGIMLYAYGSATGGASALNSSVLIAVQSSLPADPIAYENAIAWMARVDQPAAAFADSVVSIPGSAWIDQGPQASWMDMDHYRLWYSPAALNPPQWTAITPDIFNEVRSNELGLWDTHGLTPGTYNIRLNTFNNAGDSIEAVKQVTLLPSVLGVEENSAITSDCYPNPASGNITIQSELFTDPGAVLIIRNAVGQIVYSIDKHNNVVNAQQEISLTSWPAGLYNYEIFTSYSKSTGRFAVVVP